MLIQKPIALTTLYQTAALLPERARALRRELADKHQRHVFLQIAYHDSTAPLLRQQRTHEEPCDSYAPGQALIARIDSLLTAQGPRLVITAAELAASSRTMQAIERDAKEFLHDAAQETGFVFDFTGAAEAPATVDLVENLPLINSRAFIQNLLQDSKIIVAEIHAVIKPVDPMLARNADLRAALAAGGQSPLLLTRPA